MGADIFIGHAIVGTPTAIRLAGLHGPRIGLSYRRAYHNGVGIDRKCGELHMLRRAAIQFGRLLHHIYIFVVAHTGHNTIILNADEQPATVAIGKRRNTACYFARIRYTVLEVLLPVFSLGYQIKDVAPPTCGFQIFHNLLSSAFTASKVQDGAVSQKFAYCEILSATPGVSLITRSTTQGTSLI